MRVDAVTGQLKDAPKIPQNMRVIDFIPVGQAGIVLVINANGMILFSHFRTVENSQCWVQMHQSSLIGHCADERNKTVYSIGSVEPVIKVSLIDQN